MPEQEQGQSPTPTQPTPTPEPLPKDPAPYLPADGADQQAPLTGLDAKETLEQRQKDVAEQKRQEALDRHQGRSKIGIGKAGAGAPPPPQPKKPPPQPRPPAQGPTTPVPPSPEATPVPPHQPPQMQSLVGAMHIGMASPTMGNPTVQALVMQLFNQSKLPGQKFHMVVLPEDAWPSVETFDTIEDLIKAIKERLGTPCHVFPFIGQVMGITAGPNHHLRTPYGMLPLFDIPTEDEAEEVQYGWIGPNLHRPEAPQASDDDVVEAAADEAEEEQERHQHLLDAPRSDAVDQTPIFGEPG